MVALWVERNSAWLLVAAAAVLMLANLGNMYLWQDEAETALLSQRLGMYGLPLAFDGRNLIRQAPQDVQYTDEYVWVYHPWLPFYWTNLSFALLGPTTFAARLPYALAGLATVLLLYVSVRHHFRDGRVAMLAAVFLLLCIPFALHVRQCKYFPFAALFTVATADAYLRVREENKAGFAMPYFILSGFCLFQSNFGAFVPLLTAVVLHLLLSVACGETLRSRWAEVRRLAPALALLALLALPWAVYLQTWARGQFAFDIYRFVGHLAHYTVYLTGWVFPWPLLLVFIYLYLWKKHHLCSDARAARAVNLYILTVLTTVLFLSESFIWMYFGYIVQLVPLLMTLLALVVLHILDRSRWVGYTLIVLLVATNALHLVPYVVPVVRAFQWASLAPRRYLAETDALIATAGRLRFDLANYIYELSHDYDGPDEGIVLYLAENAQSGDMVVTNYGELPIAFYTGLDIAGGLSGYRLEKVERPEWVIDRRDGPYRDELQRIIAAGSYEAIEIPYPDLLWGNRPVPEYHKYATVQGVPHVVIHRRLD